MENPPPAGTTHEKAFQLEGYISDPKTLYFPETCKLVQQLKNNDNPSNEQARAAFGLRYLLWANLNHDTYAALTRYLARAGQLGLIRWVNKGKDFFTKQHDRNWGVRCPKALPFHGYEKLLLANDADNFGALMNHLQMDLVFAADTLSEETTKNVAMLLWVELPAVEQALARLKTYSNGDIKSHERLLDTFIKKIDLTQVCVTGRFKLACAWAEKVIIPSYDQLYESVVACLTERDELDFKNAAFSRWLINKWLIDHPNLELSCNDATYGFSSQLNELLDVVFDGMGLDKNENKEIISTIKKGILPLSHFPLPARLAPKYISTELTSSKDLIIHDLLSYAVTRFYDGRCSGVRLTRVMPNSQTEVVDILDASMGDKFLRVVSDPNDPAKYASTSIESQADLAFLKWVFDTFKNTPVEIFWLKSRFELSQPLLGGISSQQEIFNRVKELILSIRIPKKFTPNEQLNLLHTLSQTILATYEEGLLGEKPGKARFFISKAYPYTLAIQQIKGEVRSLLVGDHFLRRLDRTLIDRILEIPEEAPSPMLSANELGAAPPNGFF